MIFMYEDGDFTGFRIFLLFANKSGFCGGIAQVMGTLICKYGARGDRIFHTKNVTQQDK